MDIKFRYFSCKEGHAVSRFGTDAFVGSYRSAKGFIWNEDEVVAIPEKETIRYSREYNRVIKDGALTERTESDYKSWIKSQEKESETKPDKTTTNKKVVSARRKSGGKE